VVVAFYRPTRPTRYQIGDVYGELHFIRTAGSGTVVGTSSALLGFSHISPIDAPTDNGPSYCYYHVVPLLRPVEPLISVSWLILLFVCSLLSNIIFNVP
jgi:hypothetical protein